MTEIRRGAVCEVNASPLVRGKKLDQRKVFSHRFFRFQSFKRKIWSEAI